MQFTHITINKNRGWRGLAEVQVYNPETNEKLKMIFSFSEDVWRDLIKRNHLIVIPDSEYYYVIQVKDTDHLPKPRQQRSVLIKDYYSEILSMNKYSKTAWSTAKDYDHLAINNFIKNRNNHTTSDWNCIGIRVTPEI